jgi:hypothetical protein
MPELPWFTVLLSVVLANSDSIDKLGVQEENLEALAFVALSRASLEP